MLKAAFRKQIDDTLVSQGFQPADFSATEGREGNEGPVSFEIRYRYHEAYHFKFGVPAVRTTRGEREAEYFFDVSLSPGEISQDEHKTVVGSAALIHAISIWLSHISMELASLPTNRAVDEQRRQIEAIIEELGEVSDGYFSREEADALDAKLEQLEEKLEANARNSIADEAQLRKRIEQLERDFVELRAQVSALPKRGFVRSFAVRAARWASDPANRGLLKSGIDLARLMLPGAGETGPPNP
jgi:polyhydroxyalkanoate synthesis regulator phasin